MATTVNTVITRAVGYSTANAGLAGDTQELVRRVNFAQQAIFDRLARLNRYYYATSASATSTVGASGRSVALTPGAANGPAAGAAPVGRLLRVALPSGTEVHQVDLQDLTAEFPPRYYPLGRRLYEVDSDWDQAAGGAVVLTLTYVGRATMLADTAEPTTALLTLDDEYTDLLEIDLARWLAHKDLGRGEEEIARLDAWYEQRFQDLVSYIDGVAGVGAQRFVIPSPAQQRKQ